MMGHCYHGYLFLVTVSLALTLYPALADDPLTSETGSADDQHLVADSVLVTCEHPNVSSLQVHLEPAAKQEDFAEGDVLNATCGNASWTLIGQAQITCLSSGLWDSENLECRYITCGHPATPRNGQVHEVDSDATPGSRAVYMCEEGYELVGSPDTTCQPNGSWSGAVPACPAKCRVFMAPVNASVAYRCLHAGCSARVHCQPGYAHPPGNNEVRVACNSSGAWLPAASELPQCSKVSCVAPPSVANGSYSSDSERSDAEDLRYPYGARVTYVCDEGFRLSPSDAETMTCESNDGWTGVIPKCAAADQFPLPVATSSVPNEAELSPSARSTAGATTDAVTVVATSAPVDDLSHACPEPETIEHGTHSIDGQRVVYQCLQGFSIDGDAQRVCLANLTWSGDLPFCSRPVKPSAWVDVFLEWKLWKGTYLFKGKPVSFTLQVLKISRSPTKVEVLLKDELLAKLELTAYHKDDAIVFHLSQVMHASPAFPSGRQWQVTGQLHKETAAPAPMWQYLGRVQPKVSGFSTVSIKPVAVSDKPAILPGKGEETNVTALALGITIAVISIVIAAMLAAYCVKRKVGFKASGHRTLTSFENPVYEYENSLKENTI